MAEDKRAPKKWGPCQRPCIYRSAPWDRVAYHMGCNYFLETGESRLMFAYELFGTRMLTDEVREFLRPENCPFFEPERGRGKADG